MTFKQVAIKAAKAAGKIQSKYFGKNIKKRWKKGYNAVTQADMDSIKIIRKIILNKFPAHSILDEELGYRKSKSDYKWIIDPLDGTHNFIAHNQLFGVSIALEHKREIILGIVYFPMLKKLYYAEKGKGSFCNGKRIKVNNEKDLKKSMFIFDAKIREKTDMKLDILRILAPLTWRMRIWGVAVYNNILVAEGQAVLNIDFDSHPWDHSAALLIVEEAGGKVTDLKGRRWTPYVRDYIASNGKVHDRVLGIIKKTTLPYSK